MYRAPVDEIAFTLRHVAGLKPALEQGLFGTLSDDLIDAILAEAGRFASDEIAPLYLEGDRTGATLAGAAVTTPPGWKDLYRRWREGGWNALSAPEDHGGQGLPAMLAVAALEMWNSGAMGFAIGPTLTMGAVEALEAHASDALKRTYLPKLVSGEWMGTMNLTEPQAGSDVGALTTCAEPTDDGTYRLFGQKIFITYGEHDFTGNIVHLVLARLPDAPAGHRGISLFLVPKFLVGDDGRLGARNDVFCPRLEHKLGIHGSPTCAMIFGDGFSPDLGKGAVGWLVGEENRGLACMFTMMNNARLAVAMQGVGVAETAFQKARAYANERRQGRAASHAGPGMAPIVNHPDVQRMLLTMQALTGMARAITYSCAHAIDRQRAALESDGRAWQDRANLLTPLAKAFATDVGVEVTSLGVQVHGGMGFIEETGAAALYRDARIAPIYEGTNGIQAIDLVTRKLPLADGEAVHDYIAELRGVVDALRQTDAGARTVERLDAALDALSRATRHLQAFVTSGHSEAALAGATPYLRLMGLAAGGVYLAKAALAEPSPRRLALCRFACENMLGETEALADRVIHGADSLAEAGRHLIA